MIPFDKLSVAIRSITTQSVMNPILWLSALCLFGVVALAIFAETSFAWVFGSALLLPTGVALYAYVYLLHRDPDRLHSEKHQLELKRLPLLGDSLSGKPLSIDAVPMSKPTQRAIGDE